MLNVATLERELEATKDKGLALVKKHTATAQAENREFTDTERAEIKAVTDEGQSLKERIAKARGDEAMLADLERLTASAKPGQSAGTPGKLLQFRSLGDQFVNSPEYEFFRKGGHRTQSAWRSPSAELHDPTLGRMRAATLTEDPASGGALVVPQYLPGILPTLTRRIVVADLLAAGTTDSNLVTYMQEKVFTNAAAAVAEGAAKPESTLTFEAKSEAVRKLAHWLPVTEEMLEDVAQIRAYIDARLRLGVQLEEEDQILNGDGIAPNLLGLLNRTGLAAPVPRTDPMTNADAILTQIMSIFASSFLMPDGVIIHPTNWTATVLQKTTTGEYLTQGPFSPIQTPTMWGLPVAVTPAIAAGTGLVGAFMQACQVFRKGGIRVEASNSHQDYFIKNLVAIRAEERLALAVYRPGALGTVTTLSNTPITPGP